MGEIARALRGRGEREIEVERSRFIGIALPVRTQDDAEAGLRSVREAHPSATHHCFAYRLGPAQERLSDDGEPQGTAGLPLLETLRRRAVDFGLLVVVRYYGGRKLGRPGLYRAYLAAGQEALGAGEIAQLVPGKSYLLRVGHREQQRFLRALSAVDGEMLETEWGEDVAIRFWLPLGDPTLADLVARYDPAGRSQELGMIVRERPVLD